MRLKCSLITLINPSTHPLLDVLVSWNKWQIIQILFLLAHDEGIVLGKFSHCKVFFLKAAIIYYFKCGDKCKNVRNYLQQVKISLKIGSILIKIVIIFIKNFTFIFYLLKKSVFNIIFINVIRICSLARISNYKLCWKFAYNWYFL